MTPIPYTPDTVARIKTNAISKSAPEIAAELHWDMPMLRRVAARHNIELINPEPSAESVQPQTAVPGDFVMSPLMINRRMTLDEVVALLPDRPAQLVSILSKNRDCYVSADILAARMQCSRSTVGSIVQSVRHRLSPSRFTVTSAPPKSGGGFRLVESRRS